MTNCSWSPAGALWRSEGTGGRLFFFLALWLSWLCRLGYCKYFVIPRDGSHRCFQAKHRPLSRKLPKHHWADQAAHLRGGVLPHGIH